MPTLGTPLHLTVAAVTALAALVSTLISVPLLERLGHAYGVLDLPNSERRLHTGAVPRLGGIGIATGVTVALVCAGAAARALGSAQPFAWALLPALAWGGAAVFAVGVADDLVGVRPWQKLVAQGAAAYLVLWFGGGVDVIMLDGVGSWSLGVLGGPITVLWLIGLSNALNLIDGMDGLAGGIGVIATTAAVFAATLLGQWPVVVTGAALMGALLGFIRYNRHPARIFLGDSGSLVTGLWLGVLTVEGAREASGAVHVVVPLSALAYPLLDTAVAMARRYLRGHPFARADGRHVHHQL